MTCTPQKELGNIAIHVKDIPINKKIGAANIIVPLLATRNTKAKNAIDKKLTTKNGINPYFNIINPFMQYSKSFSLYALNEFTTLIIPITIKAAKYNNAIIGYPIPNAVINDSDPLDKRAPK